MDGGSGSRVVSSEFGTTDADSAEQALCDAYGDNHFMIAGRQKDFTFDHATISAPLFAINSLRMGMDVIVHADNAPDGSFTVVQPFAGEIAFVDSRYPDAYADPREGTLIPPGSPMRGICNGLEMRLVPLDRHAVAAYAAAVTGLDPSELAFDEVTPVSPAMGRHWVSTMAHIRDNLLAHPSLADEPILLDQAFRTLAAALLDTFPNSALTRATDPDAAPVRGEVPTAALREVLDYLDSHADEPVGPTHVADLVGRPANQVVEGLRRYRGTHPAEVLWEARLRGVQRSLLEADPGSGTTVAGIAARWGFARAELFSVAYTRAFDESPEETLRR